MQGKQSVIPCHRAELFYQTQYGEVEPFGGLHKYEAKYVDTEVAGKKCNHDIHLCEEITAGQGAVPG